MDIKDPIRSFIKKIEIYINFMKLADLEYLKKQSEKN